MSTEAAVKALNAARSRMINSISGYVLTSSPYTTEADKAVMTALKETAAAEAAFTSEIDALIDGLEGVPAAGLPNPDYAELNYLSFPYLLDVILREIEAEAALFASRAAAVKGNDGIKDLFSRLAEARRSQAKKFKEIREKNYADAAA